MKSLLFCMTRTSMRRSSIALRTALQRRSSSFVEIGELRRSDSSAMCLSQPTKYLRHRLRGFAGADNHQRIERDGTLPCSAKSKRIDLDLVDLGHRQHELAEAGGKARRLVEIERRRATQPREERRGLEPPDLVAYFNSGHASRDDPNVVERFGPNAAQPDDDDGPPIRIAACADDHLDSRRVKCFDQDSIEDHLGSPPPYSIVQRIPSLIDHGSIENAFRDAADV